MAIDFSLPVGVIFHTTPLLGQVTGPPVVYDTLPQSTMYKAVPFWLNRGSVGLNSVVELFRLRKSEIVLLSVLRVQHFGQ